MVNAMVLRSTDDRRQSTQMEPDIRVNEIPPVREKQADIRALKWGDLNDQAQWRCGHEGADRVFQQMMTMSRKEIDGLRGVVEFVLLPQYWEPVLQAVHPVVAKICECDRYEWQ